MIFLKNTFAYLKKSFLALIVALIMPSILLGIFIQPFSTFTFLPAFFKEMPTSFSSIFFMFVSLPALKTVYPYILVVASLIIGFSYALGIIEKHFKTGKLGISNPIRSINNSALSVIKTLPLLLITLLIAVMLEAGLISLIGLIFSHKIVIFILTTIISLAIFVFLIMLTLVFFVWAVIMQIYGYSFTDAFVETMRTVSKRWLSFVVGLLLPAFVLSVPTIVINSLGLTDKALTTSISTLTYLVACVYCVAYVFVSVYDLNGLIRRDKKHFYSNSR